MKPQLIIFDLDGTLYDASLLHLRIAMSQIAALPELLAERKARKILAGQPADGGDLFYAGLFGLIAGKLGRSIAEIEDWYEEDYLPGMVAVLKKHYAAREGLVEFIGSLKAAGILTAVLSDYGMAREKLGAIGVDPSIFDGVFEAPAAGGLKPCAQTFLNVCSQLGAEPSRCIMIGNREDTDGSGALAAGMEFIKVPDKGPVDFSRLLPATDF